MPFLQPKSVLHLMLIGFVVAIAPLCLATLYTIQTLGELSEKNRFVTDQIVTINRQGQEIQRDILDLERRGRQYLALKNPELLELFQRERDTTMRKLTDLGARFDRNSKLVTDLYAHIADLQPQAENKLITQFEAIAIFRPDFDRWLQNSVDKHITDHATETDNIKDSLLLMVLLMAIVTLTLLLFFTYWINRPIKRIAKEINRLGDSELSQTVEISGPQELRVLGQELEWLRLRLNEIDQQKQKFLRHISHELKTPLANLREGSDLLADQIPGPLLEKQQEIVAIMQQNSLDLQRLIENLLDYNRQPVKRLKPELTKLEPFTEQIINNYQISIETKHLKIHNQWDVKRWIVDRQRLKTALDNVISNAVNYTSEGGNIEINCKMLDGQLVIAVANSGPPIPAKDEAHLFEPFFQGKSSRSGPIKGSGIGLSVAKECMEAQGGDLILVKHPKLEVCFKLVCPTLAS